MWNWLTLFRNIPGLARWRKSARQGTMLSGKVLDVSFRSCGLWLWKIFITKGYERTEWSVFFCFAQSIVWGLTCLDRPGGWGDIFPTGSTRQKDPPGGWRQFAWDRLHCIALSCHIFCAPNSGWTVLLTTSMKRTGLCQSMALNGNVSKLNQFYGKPTPIESRLNGL